MRKVVVCLILLAFAIIPYTLLAFYVDNGVLYRDDGSVVGEAGGADFEEGGVRYDGNGNVIGEGGGEFPGGNSDTNVGGWGTNPSGGAGIVNSGSGAGTTNQGGGTGSTNPSGGSAPINFGLQNPLKAQSLNCFVSDILKLVVNLGSIVCAFFIIYAGYLFVSARGNETQLTKAKSAFFAAIIGTALLLGSWVIAKVIVGTIGDVTGTSIQFSSCD